MNQNERVYVCVCVCVQIAIYIIAIVSRITSSASHPTPPLLIPKHHFKPSNGGLSNAVNN